MELARKMHGTFSVHRVPAGGICRAKKLGFKSDSHRCLVTIEANDALSGFPCGATGSTPKDPNGSDLSLYDFNLELR